MCHGRATSYSPISLGGLTLSSSCNCWIMGTHSFGSWQLLCLRECILIGRAECRQIASMHLKYSSRVPTPRPLWSHPWAVTLVYGPPTLTSASGGRLGLWCLDHLLVGRVPPSVADKKACSGNGQHSDITRGYLRPIYLDLFSL